MENRDVNELLLALGKGSKLQRYLHFARGEAELQIAYSRFVFNRKALTIIWIVFCALEQTSLRQAVRPLGLEECVLYGDGGSENPTIGYL